MDNQANGHNNGDSDSYTPMSEPDEVFEGTIAPLHGATRKTIQIPLGASEDLQDRCDRIGLDPLAFLRAVWLLVLHIYGGTNSPCFGYAPDNPESVEKLGTWNVLPAICSGRVLSTVSIRQFCAAIRLDRTNHLSQNILDLCNDGLCNSAMLVRSSSSLLPISKIDYDELTDLYWDEFDIVIDVEITDTRAVASLRYSALNIATRQASNIAHTFDKIASQILQSPDSSVHSIDWLSCRDLYQIQEWNRRSPESVSSCVHSLIEKQANLTPYSNAICSWDGNLTYQELDLYASSLAAILIELNVGPEVFVPIYLDKSKWAVIATLAVLKAGGACLHLSPEHPISRTLGILRDTESFVIITDDSYATLFHQSVKKVVCLSDLILTSQISTAHRKSAVHRKSGVTRPWNAAFVVFTSGSTGKPKGVVKEHRAICTSALSHGKTMRINKHCRVLSFASYVWDISINDIISTLIHGACLCIPSDFDRTNRLASFMEEMKVTIATFTPSVVQSLGSHSIPSLRTLVLGGEPISISSIRQWLGKVSLMSNYGASETSISIARAISKTHLQGCLGQAISCSRTWIVDPQNHHKLVPIGATGELVIEGPAIARGYLDSKISNAFFSHPDWIEKMYDESKALHWNFYKTGDLAHYNLDGSITLVGRKDHQVKLRGQRIEIGEIEYHLRNCLPSTAEAAVSLIDTPGRKNVRALAVFLSLPSKSPPHENGSSDQLKQSLRAQMVPIVSRVDENLQLLLPGYMIPSLYVPVTKIPRTLNGKRDLKQLNDLSSVLQMEDVIDRRMFEHNGSSQTQYKSANGLVQSENLSALELQMAKIWLKVLGLDSKSLRRDDCFFRLGGNSIDAMNLVESTRKEGLGITVSDIFQNSTLSKLSDCARRPQNSAESQNIAQFEILGPIEQPVALLKEAVRLCSLGESDIEDIYPATMAQIAMISATVLDPSSYIAKHTFELKPGMSVEEFQRRWDQLAAITPELRTHFAYFHAYGWMHVRAKPSPTRFEELDEVSIADKGILSSSFSLWGLMSRCIIVRGSKGEPNKFAWVVHHNIYDGWGIRVLRQRFERICAGEILAAQPDYRTVSKYHKETRSKAAASYWRTLAQGHAALQFPMYPLIGFEPVATQMLHRYVKVQRNQNNTHITETTQVQAAWMFVVSRYTNSSEVILNTVQSGRTAPVENILEIVGTTLNDVPVRGRLDYESSMMTFFEAVQSQYSESLQYDTYGTYNIQTLSPDAFTMASPTHFFLMHSDEELESKIYKEGEFNELSRIGVNEFAGCPLALDICPMPDGFRIEYWWDPKVLSQSQIDQIDMQFEQTIQQFFDSSNHATPLKELQTLTSKDSETLLEWAPALGNLSVVCIHDLIKQNVERHHNKIAIYSWDGDVSYGQLWDRASRLATKLSLMLNQGAVISVLTLSSQLRVISILAILMTGRTFSLLDCHDSLEELKSIVDLSRSELIIAVAETKQLASQISNNVITLDDLDGEPESINGSITTLPISSTFAAYVAILYEKGRPSKMLTVSHQRCCAALLSQIEARRMTFSSRMLQFSSSKFETCIEEILAPLVCGGCVCLPNEDDRVFDLAGTINKMNVNMAKLPSLIAASVLPEDVPCLADLDLIIIRDKDRVSNAAIVKKWAKFVDLGITFQANGLPVSAVYDKEKILKQPDNIGRPFNSRFWIKEGLGTNNLATIGAIGEIIIEEACDNDTAAANESQKQSIRLPSWYKNLEPASQMLGSRILAKYQDDGSLTIIGPADGDKSLDSNRIYVCEVESCVTAHDLVTSSLVVRPKEGPFAGMLTAIYQPKSSNRLTKTEKRMRALFSDSELELSEEIKVLSIYMMSSVPSWSRPVIWIPVNRFSLTIAERLDRGAAEDWISRLSSKDVEEINKMQYQYSPPFVPTDDVMGTQISIKLSELAGHWNLQNQAAFKGRDVMLRAAGLDYIQVAELTCFIEQTYSVKVGFDILNDEMMTVCKLADYIKREIAAQSKCEQQTPLCEVLGGRNFFENQSEWRACSS